MKEEEEEGGASMLAGHISARPTTEEEEEFQKLRLLLLLLPLEQTEDLAVAGDGRWLLLLAAVKRERERLWADFY